MFRTIVIAVAVAGLGASAPAQMTQFCRPGVDVGVMLCPCANPPVSPALGCNNFGQFTGGATLDASGVPATDTVTLHVTGANLFALVIFLQSRGVTPPTGVQFAAGVRCLSIGSGSFFKRMYTGIAHAGMIDRPGPGDLSIMVRSASPPGPIDVIIPGSTRYYFAFYRDPNAAAPCGNTALTFNCSNSGSILW